MAHDGGLIFRGAEAEVHAGDFLGRPIVTKRRVAKSYRHGALDERIRRERTKLEALVLAEAHEAGVPVPRVFDVDLAGHTLALERVEGDQLRVVLDRNDPGGLELCREFGRLVARLHTGGLTHGDLTTSNLLLRDGRLVLLDFGLAQRSRELEDRGVDLHLVERTFESSHPGQPDCLAAFCEGYRAEAPDADRVLKRVDDIKARGRYV